MAYWERVPPAGDMQYLTQQKREDQWLDNEKAATRFHTSRLQYPEMYLRRYGFQQARDPPTYEYTKISQNTYWQHNYGPLRGHACPNVTLQYSGEIKRSVNKEPYFPSNEFSTPSIVGRGHEDISHHSNADRYYVGWEMNKKTSQSLENIQRMLNSNHSNGHARGHFMEHSNSYYRGESTECSRGFSKDHSYGGSRRRSCGYFRSSSRGGSRNTKDEPSGRSRGRLTLPANHVNTLPNTTKRTLDIQNTKKSATVSAGNNKHGDMPSGQITSPVQSTTATAQQCISMDLPVPEATGSCVVDLKVVQVTNADTYDIPGPSFPSKAVMLQTDTLPGNAAHLSHTQSSATPEQQHTSCSSPECLQATPQGNPPNKNISLKKIQDWIMSLQTESETWQKLNKITSQGVSPCCLSAEDSTLQLEIKSTHRSMTLTAVTATPPPVAIVPPMDPTQSPEPMETGDADKEVPFQILQTWSLNEQKGDSLQESTKDGVSFPSALNEKVEKEMLHHKPIETSATSSLTSAKKAVALLHCREVIAEKANEIKTIEEVVCNDGNKKNLYLSTIDDIQVKLHALQQLVNDLENAHIPKEPKEGCLETLLKRFWGKDVDTLKDLTDEKIMQEVSAWATEDENAVVLFAVSGLTLQELVEKFPIGAPIDSSLLVGNKSSWLKVNKNLDDIDKESERSWSLCFIPDQAEDNAIAKMVEEYLTDDFSKTDTVNLPLQQSVDTDVILNSDPPNDKLITDIEPQKDVDSATDTGLSTDADSKTDHLSKIILTVLTPDDAVKLFAEINVPEADLPTDEDLRILTDVTIDCNTETHSPINVTVLAPDDAVKLFSDIVTPDTGLPTDENLRTLIDTTIDSNTDTLSPMNLTVLTPADALKLFSQIDKGSVVQMGWPAPCSKNQEKIQTEQSQNIGRGCFKKICYCPCITETDNGFEMGLCFSCQKEKIKTEQCLTLSGTCGSSDQEMDVSDSIPSCLPPNSCRDKVQRQPTEEADDKQFSDPNLEENILQCTGVIKISGILFSSDTNEDSDQETKKINCKLCSEHETKPAICELSQERTTHSKPSSENKEILQEDVQDCMLSTLSLPKVVSSSELKANLAHNWCSPIEDCDSLAGDYNTIADSVNQYKTHKVNKKTEKENPLHPVPTDKQDPNIGQNKAKVEPPPTPSPKCSGGKMTVDSQHRHKKLHSQKSRHFSERNSDYDPCQNKNRESLIEQQHKGSRDKDLMKKQHSNERVHKELQSRHKKRRQTENVSSQSMIKKSRKRASTETEGRYSSNSKELQPQPVEGTKNSRSENSMSCPGVKSLHVHGSSPFTASFKCPTNVPEILNCLPSKHTEGVPKLTKGKAPNKIPRHHSTEMSWSPNLKDKHRTLQVKLEKLFFLKPIARKGSPPNQETVEGSPPGQRRVEKNKGEPGISLVKALMTTQSMDGNLDQTKLKGKAARALISQKLKLPKTSKAFVRNEEGRYKTIKRQNNSLVPKPKLPRIPKLSKIAEIRKNGNEDEKRPDTSPDAFPEPQLLKKSVRVAHKPKTLKKHFGQSIHAFSNLVSLPHGNTYFEPKVSARQQVFSDWESSFVPTPPPRIRRRLGCLSEEVEGPHVIQDTRIIRSILKQVDAQPKPMLKVTFSLNPRKVHFFKRLDHEMEVMFNRSCTDPDDIKPSDKEDTHVNCKNRAEQPCVWEEKMQDLEEGKPGPSGSYNKILKRKHEMPAEATVLMKKSIVQAKILTKCIHREAPKDPRKSAEKNGVGYKWSNKRNWREK